MALFLYLLFILIHAADSLVCCKRKKAGLGSVMDFEFAHRGKCSRFPRTPSQKVHSLQLQWHQVERAMDAKRNSRIR